MTVALTVELTEDEARVLSELARIRDATVRETLEHLARSAIRRASKHTRAKAVPVRRVTGHGKFAHVNTSADDFAARKREEI